MRLPLGAVNLFGMHIIPPLTINAGTHCTYPQRGWRLCSTLLFSKQNLLLVVVD